MALAKIPNVPISIFLPMLMTTASTWAFVSAGAPLCNKDEDQDIHATGKMLGQIDSSVMYVGIAAILCIVENRQEVEQSSICSYI